MVTQAQYDRAISRLSSIGPWQIKSLLGQGGSGAVFSTEKYAIDGSVEHAAVKIMNEPIQTPAQLSDFIHEYNVLRRISSDYVAKVVDSGQMGLAIGQQTVQLPWIATDLVQGSDLEEEISRHGPLDPGQWLDLAHDLLTAVSVTHAAGVMHFDIKPSNVMRWARRSILVDFGGAIFAGRGGIQRNRSFTIAYCAPEQLDLENSRPLTYQTDLFAVGTTLAYAATGQRPWTHRRSGSFEDTVRDAHANLLNTPPQLYGLTPIQSSLIVPMLQTDPENRGTAQQALERVVSALPPGSSRALASGQRYADSAPYGRTPMPASEPSGPLGPPLHHPGAWPAYAPQAPSYMPAQHPQGQQHIAVRGGIQPSTGRAAAPERAFLAAWLLSLFLGIFGADRFYLGKYKTAVVKLLTFGGLFVWAFVDLVLLVLNQTSDAAGRPIRMTEKQRVPVYVITGVMTALYIVWIAVSSATNPG